MQDWKGYVIVLIISFLLFGSYTVKSLIDYRNLLHNPIHGVITDCKINKDQSTYTYYTNKDQIFDGYYYFRKNAELQPIVGDYVLKLPHSLDLFIFTLGEDGDYYIKGKVLGIY